MEKEVKQQQSKSEVDDNKVKDEMRIKSALDLLDRIMTQGSIFDNTNFICSCAVVKVTDPKTLKDNIEILITDAKRI